MPPSLYAFIKLAVVVSNLRPSNEPLLAGVADGVSPVASVPGGGVSAVVVVAAVAVLELVGSASSPPGPVGGVLFVVAVLELVGSASSPPGPVGGVLFVVVVVAVLELVGSASSPPGPVGGVLPVVVLFARSLVFATLSLRAVVTLLSCPPPFTLFVTGAPGPPNASRLLSSITLSNRSTSSGSAVFITFSASTSDLNKPFKRAIKPSSTFLFSSKSTSVYNFD